MSRIALTANSRETRNEQGRQFIVIDADAEFRAQFKNGGKWFLLAKGMSYSVPAGFTEVRFESVTSQEISYEVTDGELVDNRLVLSDVSESVPIADGPVTVGTAAAVTATASSNVALVTANPARKSVLVYNDGPGVVFIQPDATADKSAMPVGYGTVLPVPSRDALRVYNPNATDCSLFVQELS